MWLTGSDIAEMGSDITATMDEAQEGGDDGSRARSEREAARIAEGQTKADEAAGGGAPDGGVGGVTGAGAEESKSRG